MRADRHTNGFTLIEILIVVGIIAVLTAMVIGIAGRIEHQSNERLVKETFAILAAALSRFADYGYNYNAPYTDFKFPLDCNDFDVPELETTLSNALGVSVSISQSGHTPNYSGSEVMYLLLSQVPECKKTLERIDKSLVTKKDENKIDMDITVGGRNYPLIRVIDPWGETLRYDYYNEWETDLILRDKGKRTFPVLTSAGPDGRFGTRDDISSK